MKTVNTKDLEGAALDWAVANALGDHVRFKLLDTAGGSPMVSVKSDGKAGRELFSPSTDWAQCGPLVNEHDVWLSMDDGLYIASCGQHTGKFIQEASDAKIAICRAVVFAKLGDTVDVPESLL